MVTGAPPVAGPSDAQLATGSRRARVRAHEDGKQLQASVTGTGVARRVGERKGGVHREPIPAGAAVRGRPAAAKSSGATGMTPGRVGGARTAPALELGRTKARPEGPRASERATSERATPQGREARAGELFRPRAGAGGLPGLSHQTRGTIGRAVGRVSLGVIPAVERAGAAREMTGRRWPGDHVGRTRGATLVPEDGLTTVGGLGRRPTTGTAKIAAAGTRGAGAIIIDANPATAIAFPTCHGELCQPPGEASPATA
jgi:hypothetical protein